MTAMLEVRDLKVAYGKIVAVKKISFSVEEGQVVTLIGTNGAGKTTTLRTISGLIRPVGGEILFQGKRIDAVPAHEIVSLGVAHSPEGRKIFPKMTVEENLLLGAFARSDGGIKKDLAAAYDLFPILGERRSQQAGTFSGGEQQMLAMGRAMMSRPKLLMLDEPSMGLSPLMMKVIMTTVRTLQSQGTTILLVEQNAQAALSLADHGYVLEVGKIVIKGTGKDLLVNDDVRKAYLGEDCAPRPRSCCPKTTESAPRSVRNGGFAARRPMGGDRQRG
jgi:branched-chain amino acid transport system ATP-binding protein